MNTTTHHPSADDLHNALHAYALTLTAGNRHQANELLQETLLHITHNATAHVTTGSLITCVMKAMRDIHQRPTPYTDINELNRLCYNGTSLNHAAYTQQEIMHAMSRLTPQQATVVTLRLKGYTPQEIAHTTGYSTAMVHTNLIKACQRLKTVWSN